ncbi:helix-turn-helix domain-containing protein [Deinococcus sp.]|uniref:PucR family transcriptional regulator n=1 Tax=Deinococcus sp. TaxID=47478 RepID=UPI002869B32D|nr:helix-turn-helix domain-containing protein [Deinococcus sp.]
MPRLTELRASLALSAPEGDALIESLEDAVRLCSEVPSQQVIHAVSALSASGLIGTPDATDVTVILQALRGAAMDAHPERALTALLAAWTGGRAEIRASWGDVVATAGRASGPEIHRRLVHRERHVGELRLAVPSVWGGLAGLAAEYALLARLQSAAAGAARRRVGERVLEALLTGGPGAALGGEPFAVAVASLPPATGLGPSHLSAREDALDVLAAVGEGYLTERMLDGHSTVWHGQAVWLWSTLNLAQEGRELHGALVASTALDVRVGVSARHTALNPGPGSEVRAAYSEARQALDATRRRRGMSTFMGIDPLAALLARGQFHAVQAQVSAQLATLDDDGRVEATLRAYLGHRGSLGELAGVLGIHVNTLRYRLRRAEDVLGAPLSDPHLLARLYLAFESVAPRP